MAKIDLIIADPDEYYIKGLMSYLTINSFNIFNLIFFTDKTSLCAHIKSGCRIDILLAAPEFLEDEEVTASTRLVIALSDAKTGSSFKGELLNKYQTGEILTGKILAIYEKHNPSIQIINMGNMQTRIIGVFSPAGGTGKTSVALGAAMVCAQEGRKALYLCMEGIQAGALYFGESGGPGLSNLFYHIKEKKSGLSTKIEGIRIIDQANNIHYFNPFENILDWEEIRPEDMAPLILQLREMKYYEFVFIDMNSDLNVRNLEVLENCDRVITLLTQEEPAYAKLQVFLKEAAAVCSRTGRSFVENLVLVMNKYNPSMHVGWEDSELMGKQIAYKLPQNMPMLRKQDERTVINIHSPFGEALSVLLTALREGRVGA